MGLLPLSVRHADSLCVFLRKHEILLSGGHCQELGASNAKCIHVKIEYKLMFAHEWSADDHIISIDVDHI